MNISYVDYFFFCLFLDILTFLWTVFTVHYHYFCELLSLLVSFSYSFFPTLFSFSFSISLFLSTIFTIPRHTLSRQCRVTRVSTVIFSIHTHTPRNLYTARVHFILRAATRNSLRIARRLSTSHFQFIFLHHYLSLRPCVFILWRWQIVLLHLSLHRVYSV